MSPSLADRSQLFVVNTSDSVSLFVVHDQPQDGDGGRAQMRMELSGDPDGAARIVEDDAGSDLTRAGNLFGPNEFQMHQAWSPCCTDGLVIGALEGNWSILDSFNDVDDSAGDEFEGIVEWVVTSLAGTPIPLNLILNRRVRLDTIMAAGLDIKPGSDPKSINPRSRDVVPLAILSSPEFDAPNQLDISSVTCGRSGNEDSLAFCPRGAKDVNGDGFRYVIQDPVNWLSTR